jgi:hypothetical protein
LWFHSSDGRSETIPLEPQPVAAFYRKLLALLSELDLPVRITRKPNEPQHPIRFDEDDVHRAYDAEYANRFWRVLVQAERVLNACRR